MATRNGVDVVESTVEVRGRLDGSFDVVSVVTTLEYSGASSDFAKFLASELREGRTFPRSPFATLREDPFVQPEV